MQVVDPAGLFRPAALLAGGRQAGGWRWSLELNGRPHDAVERYTGSLTLLACLDAACTRPLAGTPLAVPFDVQVQGGPALDVTRVEVASVFGSMPAPRRVGVALPALASGWAARNITPFSGRPQRVIVFPGGPFSPQGGPLQDTENATDYGTAPHLDITFGPAPPGVHRETVRMVAEFRRPDGRVEYRAQDIEVVYTVDQADPAIDHVFHPPQVTISRRAGDTTVQWVPTLLVTADGVSAVLQGVVYDDPPSDPNSQLSEWLGLFPYPSSSVCLGRVQPGGGITYECLPPGTYTARLRYRLDSAAGSREVSVPVVLTLAP